MKKVSSKILAILLSFAVVLSMMPGMAFADGGSTAASVTVKVRAQDEYAFKYTSDSLTVTADTAEKHGYSDAVNKADGVSALDVLVAAHADKYGEAFTAATAGSYLSMSGGNAVEMFDNGNTNKVSGFAINHAYPKDSSGNGYSMNTAPVSNGATVDFFYYEGTYWDDYITWFEDEKGTKLDKINVGAGYEFKLSVHGFMYMNGYSDPESPAIINETEDYGTVIDADDAEIKYGDLSEVDENGFITLKFDNPGTYHLTTSGFVESNSAPMLNAYLTVVVSDVSSKMYLDNEPYDGSSDITVKLGSTHNLTGYVTDNSWSVYEPCSFNTYYGTELGVDDTAADESFGYGASITFAPQKAGSYSVTLDSANGTVKSVNIVVEPNDLRGLSDGPLDFYSYREGDESSMLGNNWYAGNELKAMPGESSDAMTGNYRYLSAYTTAPEGTKCEDMTVNWYYSNVYSPTGNGYTKVTTSGKGKGTVGNISYYNWDGFPTGETYFFNITPDTSKSGTYYYYVVVSDGTHSITSISNQAVVCIGTTASSLEGIGDDYLKFYSSGGFELSMLGNNWYSGNELKATVGDSYSYLLSKYKYLSACTIIPDGTELKDMSVKWYYGSIYSETGEGYKEVEIPKAAGTETQIKGTAGNLYYQNTKKTDFGEYYNFQLVPDNTKSGTYYYYAVISDGEHTISSVTSQAMVIISPVSSGNGNVSTDAVTATFRLDSYGSFPGISSTSKSVTSGATAYDLFKLVLESKGYTFTRNSSDYVSSVTSNTGVTLSELDYGPNSGWMYRVNNSAPTVGMNSYVLSAGDTVIFYYVQDYTKDPYAIASMPSEDKAPTISITDKDGKDASSMGKVEYDASSNCVDISPSSGYKVSDVKVNGVSKGAVTRLEGIKATDRIEVVFEAASAESETPAVSDQTAKIIAGVQAIKPKVTNTRLKSGIKVYWKKNSSYKVSYYQVYRKTGKNGTYKLIYTTKLPTTLKITNVKNLKKGKTYYYRVRGVRVIDGKKYYTKWSNYTYRKFR